MNKFREPVSGLTHLFGVIISIIGLILLIKCQSLMPYATTLEYVAIIMFGISLILLYTASSVYHLVKASEKVIKFLRRLDHSMIYILIAGTYTPVCLISLQGKLRWILFIGIWSCALMGIVFKMVWFNSPRWLSTLFYVLMGWIAVFIISPLSKIIDTKGLILMFLGGVLYTLGAIIYATKWPKIKSKIFGFHEIFHLFVLGGSLCHYFMVLKYII
ncbi:PAQR family membrane homeostasis protein TrhA [Clostridium botulinum]|uniref:Hemolysin n=1 Tax=Clostridium botulinum TaxID=1491 RepID=A0A9Q1ZAS4_CLOBO|nr:hemolysin III family protein [Clostridium botulinum]AEB76257.1 hemolysin III [Clostridium botulinum BKT015925]KEH98185.1 hemolysin [Clostridium botulinum D str. 16868]KEI00683.1 hemolysin [Clostridium botulinum C/D str. Sp77]KLU75831.1 hemolysin [Clostridium botulinum V891]KOA75476.1 hemolysin [Clostridium botulinum]